MIKTSVSSGRLPAAANSFIITTLAVVVNIKLDNNGLNRRRHSKLVKGPCTMTSLASEGTRIIEIEMAKIHSEISSINSGNIIIIRIRNSKISTERQLIKMEAVKRTHFISKAAARIPVIGRGKPKKISLKSKLDKNQAEKLNMISSNGTCTICFIASRERISSVRKIKVVKIAEEKVIETHSKHGIESRTFMIQCTHITL